MTDTQRKNTITEVKNELFIESIKGLFLMNGGGAVALATWLQAVWDKEWSRPMLEWHLWGMGSFGFGVFAAGVSFVARFLVFYHPKTLTPLKNPIWWVHVVASLLSIVAFGVAAILVVKGGFAALALKQAT